MVLKPVHLFSQDEVIGEKEKKGGLGWSGAEVDAGRNGRGEKGRWTEGGGTEEGQ